ncbi:MAG: NFACT family protein, partial [Acidaminobacteraceae bacterium]
DLYVEIMGKHSNIILVNEIDVIIDSIKRIPLGLSRVRQILPGLNYSFLPSDKLSILEMSHEDIVNNLKNSLAGKIFKQIYIIFDGFSPLVAKDICTRVSIDRNIDIKELSNEEINSIADEIFKIKNILIDKDYKGYIAFEKSSDTSADFHILDMKVYDTDEYTIEHYEYPTDVINNYYLKKDKENRIHQKSSNLRKAVIQRLDRAKNKFAKLEEEQIIAENADEFKLYGELILSNLYKIEFGMEEIKVVNYYTEDQSEITIPLRPRLTPSENSQKYYKKYNKLKNGQIEISKQLIETSDEISYLDHVLTNIDNTVDTTNLDEIRAELAEIGYMKKKFVKKGKKHVKSKPLEFVSTDGFDIFVGRNNKENDILTLKFASNKDIWLHTKIIPGSHVIIRTHGKEVPESTIVEAATIAAFHSKAKMSSQVPVDYTIVKNVSKPGGAKPGMVIYNTNSTVYVTPDEEEVMKLKKVEVKGKK